jgi:2-oxoisovalerate dehydrogenase E1 component
MSEINFSGFKVEQETLIKLYKDILLPRMIEEKMLILLRKGVVSKWFSGIGQEAISVGVTNALKSSEYILPLHRNLGVFTTRGCNLNMLFAQLQGKESGYSKARERSFHFGTNEHSIVGMISHLGPQLSLGAGIALAEKLSSSGKISVAFTGEGGTSQGEFHEALNTASVWKLPIIFIIENNGYGLSTTTKEQYACEKLSDRAIGYGMRGYTIDGNNVLEVYTTVKKLAEEIRVNPEPILFECNTFRMRGHEEASGTKYVPEELFQIWKQKDPLTTFEQYLVAENYINIAFIEETKEIFKINIQSALDEVLDEPEPVFSEESLKNGLFMPHIPKTTEPKLSELKNMRLVDAISNSLELAMETYPNLVLMGQDIAEYGGVFKVTEGFLEKFGKERVRNTTLCESAIVGIALGLSIKGYKAMVEMQFADFVTCGFNQIVNNLAKIHWRWEQNADVVIRMPTGAGVGAGPFHSQSNEAWFFHVPGLKIVYPSSPYDAKGLLLSSIDDPNPVMFFEHKALYRSISGDVPTSLYTIPIGVANCVLEGDEISIITYGAGVHWVLDYVKENQNVSIDLIDLRTLLPWDQNAVYESVKKTGKVLVLQEDTITGGIGAEIAAWISENCFKFLDAPVFRLGSLDTPIPFNPNLEKGFLPKHKLPEKISELLNW